MKRNRGMVAALGLTLLLGLVGCKKDPITANFDVKSTFQVTVPASTFLNLPIEFNGINETSNSETQYELYDTRKDLLETVFLKSLYIEIDQPSDEDLNFLAKAEFFINASDEPEQKIAYKDPVPDNIAQDLAFDVVNVDLAPYLKKEPFSIRSLVTTDEQRNRDIVIKGTAIFDVTARVIDL